MQRHVVLFDMRATCQSMASSLFLLWGLELLISYCVTVLGGVHNNATDSHHRKIVFHICKLFATQYIIFQYGGKPLNKEKFLITMLVELIKTVLFLCRIQLKLRLNVIQTLFQRLAISKHFELFMFFLFCHVAIQNIIVLCWNFPPVAKVLLGSMERL